MKKYHVNVIRKNIDKDYNESNMNVIQDYCKELTGARSVPRVFVNGQFIGGCDDTEKLDNENKLKPLIDAVVNNSDCAP